MEALYAIDPRIEFEIFSDAPKWFFEKSLSPEFEYHSLLTDIGLVQTSPLKEDLAETINRLNKFIPFNKNLIRKTAHTVKEKGCKAVICDIAPMGIMVAEKAGIPSILIENFTWDWIYEGYRNKRHEFEKHITYFKNLFNFADYHILAEPFCDKSRFDLITPPISREPRTSGPEIRRKLQIPLNAKAVILTMGGITENYSFLKKLSALEDICFIIAGIGDRFEIDGNLFLLPHNSEFYHPDLINASDGVIGKVGYSTLAEVYRAGVPFGYVTRKGFRESPFLDSFIKENMKNIPIEEKNFYTGDWLSILPSLLSMPKIDNNAPSGAEVAAKFVYRVISDKKSQM